MLKLNTSTQFKKDFKTCMKRHYNMELLQAVVDVLRVPDILPQKNRDHSLTGNYTGCRECHIQPDWLLIYRQTETELYLVSTGTHADLFGLYKQTRIRKGRSPVLIRGAAFCALFRSFTPTRR